MADKASTWRPGDPIGYLQSDFPAFELPPYVGDHYTSSVPDTLDLQERAVLALHCLTETTDPLADHEVYWGVNLGTNPPKMGHNCWQGPTIAKFMWAASLMRLMSGSDENLHVDQRWMEIALKSQGADGLIYTPTQGRPWAYNGFQLLNFPVMRDQLLQPFGNGTMLSALSHFARRDRGLLWRDAVRRVVDGLLDIAVDAGDFAYFWPSCIFATGQQPTTAEVPTLGFEGEITVIPHGLVHAYRLLGYTPALTLAGKLIQYVRRFFYAEDATFWSTPGDPTMAHFHAHARGLLAMEEYAETAHDQEVMEFVLRGYRYAKQVIANIERSSYDLIRTPGGAQIGYFPEWTNSPQWEQAEICEVADMVALALRLSEAGVGDYWDDADRWIRNMLAEGQLLSIDWIQHLEQQHNPAPVGPYETADRVPERSLGGFASHASANDWAGEAPIIAQCCTANGAKALYWAWERSLRYQDGKLRVNLLLNRASPWADVDSHIPYRGQVDVRVKQPIDLSIRIPEWVTPGETRCQVNGAERSLDWDGRYAHVGSVLSGAVATLSFPIAERSEVVHIEKQRFTLVRKGNEVVSIDPQGKYYPLYQREHYRQDTSRWREVTRFVSHERIDW
jgi:hypothetical protein